MIFDRFSLPITRVLLIVAFWSLATSRLPGNDYEFGELDQLVASELALENCPGASVAVVAGDQVVFSKGYGVASIETGMPVTSDMLFRLGSTTKMFTAAGLLNLVEQGKVKLDAPIADYVVGLTPSVGRLTAHQLLTHTSGLADHTAMNGPHDETALEDRVRLLSDSDFFDEPNTLYSYSNSGYWTAGLVIQKASGALYAKHLEVSLFRPLGMKRTTFRPTAAMTWPLAVGHGPEDRTPAKVIRPLADNAATWPAGQLFSSAPEFAQFCLAFMNDGKLKGNLALSKFVIDQLSKPHVAVPNDDRYYGYGLSVRDVQGLRWLSHSGSRTGYGSHARMCPERKFAVVILCNKTGVSLTPVADLAAKIVLGIEPEAIDKPIEVSMSEIEKASYVGVYSNGATAIPIELREGKLYFSKNRVVTKIGDRRFIAQPSNSAPKLAFSFVVDENDNVTHLLARGRAYKRQSEQ